MKTLFILLISTFSFATSFANNSDTIKIGSNGKTSEIEVRVTTKKAAAAIITITNAAGKTRDCFITEALQKKTSCDNISAGKLKVQGGNHYAIIDFGNGDCDRIATISIDGQAPRTILLR